MRNSREQRRAMVGSLVVHGVVAAILFLIPFGVSLEEPEFIELSWGASSEGYSLPTASAEPSSAQEPSVPVRAETKSLPLSLPERKFPQDQDVLPLQKHEKLDAAESPVASEPTRKPEERLQRDRPASTSPGAQQTQPGAGRSATAAGGAGPGTTEAGSDGTGVSVALEWSEGGTRKKISGALPAYPPGVNDEAQIKLETVVAPDGSVKSVRPTQRGNLRLEEAAMREVWRWKFEPLRVTSIQRDQTCLITFNFRLR